MLRLMTTGGLVIPQLFYALLSSASSLGLFLSFFGLFRGICWRRGLRHIAGWGAVCLLCLLLELLFLNGLVVGGPAGG